MKKLHDKKGMSLPFMKIDLKMKLTAIFVFATFFSMLASNKGYAQSMTLEEENTAIIKVINKIEATTKYRFVYNTKFVDLQRKVSIKLEDASIEKVLTSLFDNTNTTYQILRETQIILKQKKDVETSSHDNIIKQSPTSEKQQIEINGTVTDDTGQPLPGATVLVKGTTTGTTTDFDGKYALEIEDQNAAIIISYVGFTTQEIPVNGQTEINVQLVTDAAELDAVVLVGYGSVVKKDLTGAVATVDNIGERPVTTTEEALQGSVSGVTVVSDGGDPTGVPNIKIRGVGTFNEESPLWVVDGVPYYGGPINPFDIESITVLKDASSQAIYGVKAAGGVILVTTKKGKSGKLSFDFNHFTGFSSVEKPKALSAADRYRYLDIASNNDDPTFVLPPADSYNQITRTNWIDEIFRTGITQNYDIGARGGSDKFKYSSSIGYNKKEGTLINTEATRVTFRLNSEFRVNDKLKIGENVSYTRTNGNSAFTGTVDENGTQSYNGLILQAILADPEVEVFDENGNYNDLPTVVTINPVSTLNRLDIENITEDLFANLYFDYNILDDLKLKSSFGINSKTNNFKEFKPRSPERSKTTTTDNSLDYATSKQIDWSLETTLNYNKTFNDVHKLSLLAGHTLQRFQRDVFSITGRTFAFENDSARELINAEEFTNPVSGYGANSLMSYFGRAIYGYDGKYLLTASVRRDGTSKIPEAVSDNTWGTFPAVALAWRASEEGFLKESKTMSNLKFRASWGILGNINSLGNYPTSPQLSLIPTVLGESSDKSNGFASNTRADLGIKWELTESQNFGLDLGLLDNALTFSADYFIKDTDDLIFQLPVSSLEGITENPFVNAGKVRNKGFETSLTYQKSEGDFTYSISGNLSKINNEVLELADDIEILHDNNVASLTPLKSVVGQPLFSFFVVETDGLDDKGDLVFIDRNEDGVINDNDKVYKGSAFPDITYSLRGNFNYKNFDLNIFFQGVSGSTAFNGFKLGSVYNIGQGNPVVNLSADAIDTWHPGNTGSSNFRLSHRDDNGNLTTASDFWLEDTSYLRLKNVTLGYTFNKIKSIDRLRVYVAGENLFTVTDYSGLDPEVGLNNNGLDGGQYPVSKVFTFGLNLAF